MRSSIGMSVVYQGGWLPHTCKFREGKMTWGTEITKGYMYSEDLKEFFFKQMCKYTRLGDKKNRKLYYLTYQDYNKKKVQK